MSGWARAPGTTRPYRRARPVRMRAGAPLAWVLAHRSVGVAGGAFTAISPAWPASAAAWLPTASVRG
jgi:hypothetical protein